jgi:hypothetical protein
MAEREGFEPSVHLLRAYIRLAGEPIRPLWHLSVAFYVTYFISFMAEGAGFEPANLSVNGFQDRRHRPLGHPSARTDNESILPRRENPVNSFHVGSEYFRDDNASIGLLIILQNGDDGPPCRKARSV